MVPVKITASFSEKDAEAIARIANRTDRSMSSVMRLAVKKYIGDIEKKRQERENNSADAMADVVISETK